MICSVMIMCFVVLAFLPLSNDVCLEILKYDHDGIDAVAKFDNGATASIKIFDWQWQYGYYGYAQTIYATTIISLFGWVSDLLLLYNKTLNRQLLRDHPLFSAFSQEYREYTRGRGKSSCTLSKMLVLATVTVHETSLANQHFSTFLWYAFGEEGGGM